MSAAPALFEVRDVTRVFRMPRASLRRAPREVVALGGVTFDIRRGETFGIVGESGSGKSTLARILLALDRPGSGDVRFDGQSIANAPERDLGRLRREAGIVFQDPVSSLDPRMRVRDIVAEPLRSLGLPGDHDRRVEELLDAVGLGSQAAGRFPHEFSGGQRQRIAIARSLAPQPKVLVADEPVSALDVSVRAQILNLLQDLKERYELTLVLISHDLSVVGYVCDRVAVMHRGRIVEMGAADAVFGAPQHEYTRMLLASVPTLDGGLPEAPEETDR